MKSKITMMWEVYKEKEEEFRKEKARICGKKYRTNNKETVKASRKRYEENNKEKVRECKRKYNQNNKEKVRKLINDWKQRNKEKVKKSKKIHDRTYRAKNKNEINQRGREYYEKNKGTIKSYQVVYRSQNKTKINTYKRIYERNKMKTDISYAISKRIHSRLRKTFKKFLEGKVPNISIYEGIDLLKVVKHLDKTKPENWQKYHIDHIRPLCSFDLTDPKQLIKANNASNLQWLPAEENLRKGGRYNEVCI